MSGYQVHPLALVETDEVGAGTRVWAFAHVMAGSRIGRDCNVCDHVFVETGAEIGDRVILKNGVLVWDGVTIEDDVFVGPAASFTNDPRPRAGTRPGATPTRIRRGASIGANATIVCGVIVGEHAMIGAGSVLTVDALRHGLYLGNPATKRGWVCECGLSLVDLRCTCGRTYREESDGLWPAG